MAVLAYLIFLVVLAPATWWLKLVSLPAGVQHGAVSGTLWQGSIRQVQYQQLQLAELHWRLQPWSLLLLKAELQLKSGSVSQNQQPYMQTQLTATPSGLQLNNGLFRLPVPTLLPLLQLPLPVQAEGELVIDISRLALNSGLCTDLTGNASWTDARLQPPTGTWLELGQFNGSLSCENGSPVLITDPANILALDIRASVNAGGQLQVVGTLLPAAELPQEVHQAMRFVGSPDAAGRYRLNF